MISYILMMQLYVEKNLLYAYFCKILPDGVQYFC